jgi:plastocyanin
VGSVTGTRALTVNPVSGGGGTFPQNATVTMPQTEFVPSQVDILVNGTVDFVFTALAHDVVFSGGNGTPSNIPVTTNATVSRTFTVAGTFAMVCTLHAGMTGTVIVH